MSDLKPYINPVTFMTDILSKNILICVLKMNEGLTGLERYECE